MLQWPHELFYEKGEGKMDEMKATEHSYIVIDSEFNEPMIRGTCITIHVIVHYYRLGTTVEEIERTHPELSTAAIHSAISYYLDHKQEIDEGRTQAELKEIEHIIARNDAEEIWVSGAELRKQMVRRGVLVG